jgi:hypothetical protein
LYSESEKDISDEEKNKIIKYLDEEYNLLYSSESDDEELKKEKNITESSNNKSVINIDNFYMKKELEETYKLIDSVLLKLEKLLSGESEIELISEQKDILKNIYNSIVRLKKTTNISKLKEI